jgi:hypothetical protein
MMIFLSRWFGPAVAVARNTAVNPGGLRMVRAGDADVATLRAAAPGAFVAGHGARIYSLDAFRRVPPTPPRPRAA